MIEDEENSTDQLVIVKGVSPESDDACEAIDPGLIPERKIFEFEY